MIESPLFTMKIKMNKNERNEYCNKNKIKSKKPQAQMKSARKQNPPPFKT